MDAAAVNRNLLFDKLNPHAQRDTVLAIPSLGPSLCSRSFTFHHDCKGKGKGFPYSTSSVGPGADPGVQAVNVNIPLPDSAYHAVGPHAHVMLAIFTREDTDIHTMPDILVNITK